MSGDTLRAHESYADAPDDVLNAIVVFFTKRRSPASRTAKRTILTYSRSFWKGDGEGEGARRRRERKNLPEDTALAERLAAAHAEMNRRLFNGSLRELKPFVSRQMRSRLGHYAPAPKGVAGMVEGIGAVGVGEIAISRRHIRRDGWKRALDTLLHEMVHQWQDENSLPVNHGPDFRRKAREVGTAPAARSKLIFD